MLRKTLLITLLIALMTACAPQATPTAAPAATGITLTDGLGREVKLDAPAQHVVSLAPSNTEILFAVGAGSQVVGRDEFSDYPAEAKAIDKRRRLDGTIFRRSHRRVETRSGARCRDQHARTREATRRPGIDRLLFEESTHAGRDVCQPWDRRSTHGTRCHRIWLIHSKPASHAVDEKIAPLSSRVPRSFTRSMQPMRPSPTAMVPAHSVT